MVKMMDVRQLQKYGVFLVALIVFTILLFLKDSFATLFSQNFIIGFTIFLIIYAFAVFWFIFGEKKLDLYFIRKIIAWVLVFIVLDLVMYPFLVSKTGVTATDFDSKMSSDVFVYTLIPDSIPIEIRYYVTYTIVPSLCLFIASLLVKKQEFNQYVEHATG